MKKIVLLYLLNICLVYSKSIVSMTLTGDELLISLGLRDEMVGVCGDVVDDIRYSNIVGKTKGIPRVEGNLENIVYLKPDIVIAGSWISKDKVNQLEKLGIKVLKYRSVKNFDELKSLLAYFGKELNVEKVSEKKIEKLDFEIEKVKLKSKKIEKPKRVLFYSDFSMAFGKNTIFDEISKIGNFRNIASEAGLNGMANISEEKIVEYNPEVLLLLTHSEKNEKIVDKFLKNRAFKNIDAIKNKRVYSVESKVIMNSSPYMIDSIEEIFKKVYPEMEEENEEK